MRCKNGVVAKQFFSLKPKTVKEANSTRHEDDIIIPSNAKNTDGDPEDHASDRPEQELDGAGDQGAESEAPRSAVTNGAKEGVAGEDGVTVQVPGDAAI